MAADLMVHEVDDAKVLAALERLRQAFGGAIRVEWGTNVVYGRIHQFGGLAGRKDRRVRIDARAYLGVSAEDSDELALIGGEMTRRAFEGGEQITGDDIARAWGRYLKTSTQLRFRAQKAPDGRPWKPSKRVIAHGGVTLRLSSRLRNSIAYDVG